MARGRGRSQGAGRGTTERGREGRTVPYTLRGGSGPSTNADSAPVPATTGQPSTSQQAQVVQVDLEDLMGRIRAIVREERAEHTGDTPDTGIQGDPPLLPLPPPSGQLPVAPSQPIGGKGCRRCGSTTHQRSSHRDCPFNKKNKRLGNENNNEENDSQHCTQHVLSWNLKLFPPEAEDVLIITLNKSSLDL